MPRASLATSDATILSGFGFQQGRAKILDAKVKVHQYPPKKGTTDQSAPFPCVQLLVQKLDPDGEPISIYNSQTREHELDQAEVELRIGKLADFHPGQGDGPDDEEPTDKGEEVDAEGNMIYVKTLTTKITNFSDILPFNESLEKAGFNPAVLGRGYVPDYVGLDADFDTVATESMNKKTNKPYTKLVVTNIYAFPYDKPATTKGKTKATTAAAKGPVAVTKPGKKAAPAPAPEPEPTEDAGEVTDPHELLAIEYLNAAIAKNAGETISRAKLQSQTQTVLMKDMKSKGLKSQDLPKVYGFYKDNDWMNQQALDADGEPTRFILDHEANNGAGEIVFPEVEGE